MRKNLVARLRWLVAWLSVGSAFACIPDIKSQSTPTVSSATLALFAPNTDDPCLSVLPFPSDLAKDPVTHRLNIPYCLDDDATTTAIKTGLRTLDGYSINPVIYAPMSAAVDDSTAAGNVYLVDLSSGASVDFEAMYDPTSGRLYILPAPQTFGLDPSTHYLVVVTSGLHDSAGNPVVSDQVFTFAKSREALIDGLGHSRFVALGDADANALENLRQGFAPMFGAIETTLGIDRAEVAVAWTFTTQEARTLLEQMYGAATALGGATAYHETSIAAAEHPLLAAAGIPTTNLCDVHSGHVIMQNFVGASGTLAPGAGAPPTVSVDYVLVTPRAAGLCPAWDPSKVVVFAHGLSRCKNDALAMADTLAQGGYATLALDGPRSGARTVNSLGDQNLDGCPDQGETPEFIGIGGTNPFGVRDLLREWGVELAQVVDAVAGDAGAFAGMGPAPAGEVVLVGHSWGGMGAVLAASLSDNVSALAVNATGGELGTVFEPSIRDQVAAALNGLGVDPTVEPGLSMLEAKVNETVPTFRWILEPGDPLNALAHLPATLPVLVQVVSAGDGAVVDAPLHGTRAQELLAGSVNINTVADVTYVMMYNDGAGDVSICDSSTGIVGAMLQPCTTDANPAAFGAAYAKLAQMRSQLMFFLATGSVCGDNQAVACP